MNKTILKLSRILLQIFSTQTDKGELIHEGGLAVGVEVFVEKEGEIQPADDGEYVSEDGKIIVSEGKIAEIIVEEKEIPEEPKAQEVEQDEQEEIDKDAIIEEQNQKIAELEKLLGEKDDKIAELESELSKKEEELKMSAELPAKEKVKQTEKEGALRFFN